MNRTPLFFIFLLLSTITLADGLYVPANSIIQLPKTLDIPGNIQVGQTLWKSTPVTTYAELSQASIKSSNFYVSMKSSSPSFFGKDIYSTNIPGIGIKWWATWKGPLIKNGYTAPIREGNLVDPAGYQPYFTDTQTIWVELIKTGPIKQGTLSIASNVEAVYSCPCSNKWAVSVVGTSSVAAAPTCSLSAPIPKVVLGKISTTAFNGAGDRSSPVLFSINLACSGGDPGVSIGSYITLTDVSNPNNVSEILSLSSESTASGLGIQINNDTGIVKYGPDSKVTGSINQWKAGDIQAGASVFRIPLRASYIQTAPKITPGTAIGHANFTFSYH